MSEMLTIQERVAQQLVATIDAALPSFLAGEVSLGVMTSAERDEAIAVGTQRFDPRGLDVPWFVPVLLTGPADNEDESTGSGAGGFIDMAFSYRVQTQYGLAEGVDLVAEPARGAERMGARWVGFLIATLLADPFVIESGTGERLAHEVDLIGADTPRSKVDGQVYYAPEVDLVVMSEVMRNNPYRGAGNTEGLV
jgi:hypothetical protein